MFLRLFQNVEDEESADGETAGEATIANALRSSAYGFIVCLVLLLMVILMGFLAKKGIWSYHYNHADRSEKLLMQYRKMLRKICRKSRHTKTLGTTFARELTSSKNFEEQVSLLAQKEILVLETASLKCLIQTLNEAAFSQKEISEEALGYASGFLSQI